MESVYAALILHKAGKKVTEAAVEKILKAAGLTPDKATLTKLVSGLKGKDIDSLLASAAAAPVMAAPATGATSSGPASKAVKKEEEEEVEAEPTGIGSLF
jgi:large subunit ribosomal protein L12